MFCWCTTQHFFSFIWFSVICLSASVLSYWLRFEKVCCIKASPAGGGSFSFECFRTQKWSTTLSLWWQTQRHKLQQFLKSWSHLKYQHFIQFICYWGSIEVKTAQMYRSCGCVLTVCVSMLEANTHRHECKLPTFKVLERFLCFKSFLVVFFLLYEWEEQSVGEKRRKAATGSFKWRNHYIRC